MPEAAVPESVRSRRRQSGRGWPALVATVLGESHPCDDLAVLLASDLMTSSVRHSGSAVLGGLVTAAVTVGGAVSGWR